MPENQRPLSLLRPPTNSPASVDPYAAPRSQVDWNLVDRPSGGRVRREGKVFVMDRDAELPHRCVKCNAPEVARSLRVLRWHSTWLYLLILAGLLVYAIVAVILLKKAKVNVGLCQRHLNRRRILVGTTCALTLLSLPLGIAIGDSAGVLVVFVGWLGAAITGFGFARIVWPVRIDASEVRLRGAGEAFLGNLETPAI